MLEHTTKHRSVSIGAPGPTSALHEPSDEPAPGFDHAMPAGVAVRHQHRVAPVGCEPAARAVGDGDLRQQLAVVQPEVGESVAAVLGFAHAGAPRGPSRERRAGGARCWGYGWFARCSGPRTI